MKLANMNVFTVDDEVIYQILKKDLHYNEKFRDRIIQVLNLN